VRLPALHEAIAGRYAVRGCVPLTAVSKQQPQMEGCAGLFCSHGSPVGYETRMASEARAGDGPDGGPARPAARAEPGPKISNAAQQNATRWAVWQACRMLQEYSAEYDALRDAMAQAESVVDCVKAIELARYPYSSGELS
jgi:hypothetical protein